MNQISIAICDADSAYGNKLAEYLLETGNVAKAEVYTDWNSVEADLNEEKRDIWLINSGLLKEAETLPLKKEMVCLAEERLGARGNVCITGGASNGNLSAGKQEGSYHRTAVTLV